MVSKVTSTVTKKKKDVDKVEKPKTETKKSKKKNYQSFSIYIYKILRHGTKGQVGISKKSMLIMNNLVSDMLEKIASEAGRLASHSKKTTLGRTDVQFAVKILVTGELAKHANIEAMRAITKLRTSQLNEKAL